MPSLALSLLAVPVFLRQALAFNCSVPPIYVDIHKRSVHGTNVFQYGSFIGVGSPAQNQSLWPSLSKNETIVAHSDFCANSDLADCEVSTRGNFNPSTSTTWVENKQYASLDANNTGNWSRIAGTDDAHLYTHYFETDGAWQNLIHNYPFEVATNGSTAPGIVGMGLASTLLQKLYEAGLIAGRTYSLYIGSGFDRAGGLINGSNTFGGYDAGRFKEPVHTYNISPNNKHPLSVRVSDIIINDSTGSNVSLFDTAAFPDMKTKPSSFEARITTDQYPLSLPYQLTQNYISRLAAVPSDNPDGSLKLSKPFNGTMTIVLDDGFTVTLPNQVMYNASGLSPVASRAEKSTEPFYLSAAWLSQVYLMINYDSYTFHLAEAIVENKFVMPVTFCPKSIPTPYIPPSKSVLSRAEIVGAIVGGVLGGIFVVSFAVCAVLWCWKQRMQKAERAADAEKAAKTTKKVKMAQFEVTDATSDSSSKATSKSKKKLNVFSGWKK